MDIAHLKEFVTLASHMKLTSAARALFMSPSTLSQHISALEREVGADLFNRPNGFELTAKGEAVLEHAQKILYEYNGIQARLHRRLRPGQGVSQRQKTEPLSVQDAPATMGARPLLHGQCAGFHGWAIWPINGD